MQTTSVGPVGQKLLVHVIRAQGLQHMNHFTGDHPYVQAEIKHMGHHAKVTRAQTRPITQGDTMNPFWDERLELEPWTPGEALELTVYDKGLLGSKTEGKVMLPSQSFYPSGFNGRMLPINGLPHALLQVAVQVIGAPTTSSYAIPPATSYSTSQPTMYSTAQSTMYAQPASPVTYSQPTSIATQSLAAAPAYSSAAAPTYSSAATYAAEPATAYASPQTYSSPQVTYAAAPTAYSAPTQLASAYSPAQPAYSPASSVSVVQAPMTQSYSTAQPTAYASAPAVPQTSIMQQQTYMTEPAAATMTGAETTGASAMTGTVMSKKRGKKPKIGQKKKGSCC